MKIAAYVLAVVVLIAGAYFAVKWWSAPSAGVPAQTAESVPETGADSAGVPFRFEIVSTDAAREKGLGGRADVPPGYGMLFVFPQDAFEGFWMKDMLVPIDIIWLSDEHVILGIEDSVSPSTYPRVFYPPQPVRYVLETRAGEARSKHWRAGMRIELPEGY